MTSLAYVTRQQAVVRWKSAVEVFFSVHGTCRLNSY